MRFALTPRTCGCPRGKCPATCPEGPGPSPDAVDAAAFVVRYTRANDRAPTYREAVTRGFGNGFRASVRARLVVAEPGGRRSLRAVPCTCGGAGGAFLPVGRKTTGKRGPGSARPAVASHDGLCPRCRGVLLLPQAERRAR